MIRSWYLALKDLRLLRRDFAALFWAFGFPILFALFFGSAFSGGQSPGGMKVLIVDEDQSELSRSFIARLSASDRMSTASAKRAQALRQVRNGKASAAVLIGPGFSETLTGLFPTAAIVGKKLPLEIALDPARQMEGGYLQGLLLQARFQTVADGLFNPEKLRKVAATARGKISEDTELTPETRSSYLALIDSAETLVGNGGAVGTGTDFGGLLDAFNIPSSNVSRDTGQRPDSYFQVAFPQAILWGLLGCVSAFAVSLVQERTRGTFQRLRISPITRAQILAGKGIACFVTALAVIAVLVVLGITVFGTRISSWPLMGLTALCLALCFVGIMMFASTLGRTEQGVGGAGWALFLVMSMFGGGMLPLFVMPTWMQRISDFSPIKWGILALEGVYWRRFTLEDMLTPCAVLLGAGALFFLLGLLNMRRLDSPGRRSGKPAPAAAPDE